MKNQLVIVMLFKKIQTSVKPVLENSIGRIEKIHTYSYFIKFTDEKSISHSHAFQEDTNLC
jgi:hypothetical protein